MSAIHTSMEELIGHTPLLEFTHIEKELNLSARIIGKMECFNATGSAKDRIARKMIEDAEEKGLLKPGSTIIEETSGNTGIGLSAVATAKGYKVIIVMPDTMSEERRKLMRAYGAEVVLSDGKKGMQGAVDLVNELAVKIPDSWVAGQFVNPSNWKAHYETTGLEIWQDTDGKVDIFAAGVGTGGTLTGTGKYLKEHNPDIKVIALEPDTDALLSGDHAGPHGIQGIGANFIPEVLDRTIYDEVLRITDKEAYQYGAMIGRKEGILTGISSGAALAGAIRLAQRKENAGKMIVAVMPDSGDRYLSTKLFGD